MSRQGHVIRQKKGHKIKITGCPLTPSWKIKIKIPLVMVFIGLLLLPTFLFLNNHSMAALSAHEDAFSTNYEDFFGQITILRSSVGDEAINMATIQLVRALKTPGGPSPPVFTIKKLSDVMAQFSNDVDGTSTNKVIFLIAHGRSEALNLVRPIL